MDRRLMLPESWHDPDILRIDSAPCGLSCFLLHRLLQFMRPKIVVMLVHAQVPPPLKFSPVRCSGREPLNEIFYSCSVSGVTSILQAYGMALLRLSGPYAL